MDGNESSEAVKVPAVVTPVKSLRGGDMADGSYSFDWGMKLLAFGPKCDAGKEKWPGKREQREYVAFCKASARELEWFPALWLGRNGVQRPFIYREQWNVLRDLSYRNSRVAAKFANETGKTSVIAVAALLWHGLTFPGSWAVSTASVARQVDPVLWSAIRSEVALLGGESAGWEVVEGELRFPSKTPENRSRAFGFVANEPGRFEGFHGQGPLGNLLMVVDEAKTIPDPMFEAIERCRPTRLLVMSSPGGMDGRFYRIFTKEREHWSLHTLSAYDCAHLDKGKLKEQEAIYGEQSPLVRSMIYGEFTEMDGESLVLNVNALQKCLSNPPQKQGVEKVGFCDFAAGGDENVLAVREGNEIKPLVCWRDENTTASAGRFLMEFKKAGLEPDNVFADAGGMGVVMCDVLRDAGFEVRRVNNGERASDDLRFGNRGAEIWFWGSRAVEKCEVILPSDEKLHSQLTTRRVKYNSRGLYALEPKPEMKARGLPSPDRADAVMGTIGCARWMGQGQRVKGENIWSLIKDAQAEGQGTLAGAMAA